MCGIIGYIGGSAAESVLTDGLKRMEYRGYDSAGYAVVENGTLVVNKAAVRVHLLPRLYSQSKIGIGHTRWATHGKPSAENAHPHLSFDGKVAIAHNGIISNAAQLRTELQQQGIVLRSDTDSEVIAHLIATALYSGETPQDAIERAVTRLQGVYSFVVLLAEQPDTLFCYRNRASLLVGIGNGQSIIASDMLAIAPYATQAYIFADRELGIVTADSVTVLKNLKPIHKKPHTVTAEQVSVDEKCFMEREINQIPQALENTLASVSGGLLRIPDTVFKNADSYFYSGCGTAYHAGLYGKRMMEKLARKKADCSVASEACDSMEFLDSSTVAVFVTQSGETCDTLSALRCAKARGATTVAVTNTRGSSVSFEADYTLYTDCGAEVAVAATKSYNSQLLALYLFALHARNACLGNITDCEISLLQLFKAARDAVVADYGTQFSDCLDSANYFFVGCGQDYVTALEGALKLKEISYDMTDAYPAGELKHGTLALIDERAIAVVILTDIDKQRSVEATVAELKSRGASVIAISPFEVDGADRLIRITELPRDLLPIISVIPLQRFALQASLAKHLDPDKPRNLAKSVTVP